MVTSAAGTVALVASRTTPPKLPRDELWSCASVPMQIPRERKSTKNTYKHFALLLKMLIDTPPMKLKQIRNFGLKLRPQEQPIYWRKRVHGWGQRQREVV